MKKRKLPNTELGRLMNAKVAKPKKPVKRKKK